VVERDRHRSLSNLRALRADLKVRDYDRLLQVRDCVPRLNVRGDDRLLQVRDDDRLFDGPEGPPLRSDVTACLPLARAAQMPSR
jgi:hypothetical protein